MPGDTLVPEDWPGIFNRRANVKILRLWVVGGNEKETSWIFVVNPGRIHETARAGRLERIRQLSNLKRPKIIRQGYRLLFFKEVIIFSLRILFAFRNDSLLGGVWGAGFGLGSAHFGFGRRSL